jgi:hypothetical protein
MQARVTLNIYAHLVEGTHREAVEKLAPFLAARSASVQCFQLSVRGKSFCHGMAALSYRLIGRFSFKLVCSRGAA